MALGLDYIRFGAYKALVDLGFALVRNGFRG